MEVGRGSLVVGSRWDGPDCREQERQQQSTGRHVCGIASKSGSFKDEREWGKKCFEDLDQRRMGRPATSTWSTNFLLREGLSREEIGKWLRNKSIPWQRRRRLLQVVTGTFPCGQQLVKYGYKEKAECTLCKKAHEENGSSWKGELPKEMLGHIQCAGCLGQKEVVTAAHNACIRELLQAIDMHGKTDRHMKLLTIENRSIVLLLFLQKQNLATAIYLFGLGTLLTGLGLKHMRICSHHDLIGALVTSLFPGGPWWSTTSPTCLPLSVFTITSDQHRCRIPPLL